jgi:hypothetical protein
MERERRAFADRMTAELRRRGVTGPITYHEDDFRLDLESGVSFMLANAYGDWQRAGRLRRGAVLKRYAESFTEPGREPIPQSPELALANLMVRVRDLAFFSALELRLEGDGPAGSYRPLNEHLAVEVVYDQPSSIANVLPDQLERWGISFDEALRSARANLRDRTTGTFRRHGDGVFVSPWQDAYDASRLVLTELISRLDVQGDPVALLPHRDHLIVTGSDDADGLRRAAELAEPLLREQRRETGYAFVWRDGEWQPFQPPERHVARRGFARLAQLTICLDYEQQGAALQEKVGGDAFVSPQRLFEREAGDALVSVATWTAGVPTYLPQADQIAFVQIGEGDDPRDVVSVAWDDAVAEVGDLMRPQRMRPERWFVEAFPDDEQLARLRAAS